MKNENQFVRVFYSIEVGRKNKIFYLIYNKCNIDRNMLYNYFKIYN